MQRFFFHLYNSIGLVVDGEGQELTGIAAARRAAVLNIRSILKGDLDEGYVDMRGRIEIADEAGAILDVVPFAQAVQVRLGGDPA